MTPRSWAELRKGSVIVSGHRTSISLERAFWSALRELADQQGRSVNEVVSEIDAGRNGNLSSAVRVHILDWLSAGRACLSPSR